MRILQKLNDVVACPPEDLQQQQGKRTTNLKRSSPDKISQPLPLDPSASSNKRRVHFQSQLNDSDYQVNEDIEIEKLKKLSHDLCNIGKEFHTAISLGDDTKITLLLNGMNHTDKNKILHDLCVEEDFEGASVLRLALRLKQLSLIGTLIKQGVNPYHCSADGNTILHDIILDHNYAALKILLTNTHTDEQFIKFINLPFHGNLYEGYFSLDMICVEATFHFENYHEVLNIKNIKIAEPIFSIIQKLILNNASSKLLNDENKNVNDYLKKRTNNKYFSKSIWNLIARIAELHEIKNMPILSTQTKDKLLFSDMNSPSNLVAQRWQSNGMLSETKPQLNAEPKAEPNAEAQVETQINDHHVLTGLASSLPSVPATEAEALDLLIALSNFPPKLV